MVPVKSKVKSRAATLDTLNRTTRSQTERLEQRPMLGPHHPQVTLRSRQRLTKVRAGRAEQGVQKTHKTGHSDLLKYSPLLACLCCQKYWNLNGYDPDDSHKRPTTKKYLINISRYLKAMAPAPTSTGSS